MADKTLPPVAIGDSLAVGMRDANKIPGLGRVGAGPKEVLDMIKRFSMENSLSGRDVFIGTGMPNIPEQKKFIEEQIDFVKKQGGNPILMGVGPGTKKKPTTGQNEFLAGLAERKGLPYMGPLANSFPDITKDPMGLHLRGPQYKQLFKQYAKPQSQQVQPQVQPDSRAPRSADLLSQFTGAVMQAESLGKRYDKSGKLLTSKAGAMGEMQVMPGTVRDPGFGVRPAKDNSPDELARVGRDYAATMLRRYNNDPTAAAVAYNWGPGNADKWVKRGADFGALPKETQNYVTRITGQMGIPIAAKRAPAPKRADTPPMPRAEAPVDYKPGSTLESAPRTAQQQPPQQDQITRADMERLGPNYQAAFAAVTLADSREDDDEYDDDETIAERYMERREMQLAQEESTLEEEEPARTSPLASLELSYQSPFPQEQPVMMAKGGEAKSALRRMYESAVPAQVRTFAETALMPEDKRAASTITEQNFTDEEQRQILDTIVNARKRRMEERGLTTVVDPAVAAQAKKRLKKALSLSPASIKELEESQRKRKIEDKYFLSGKGTVFYGDYPNAFTGKVGAPVQNLRDSTIGREGAMRNTLGRFVYETTPEGKINIKEQYDFADDLAQELNQRPSSAYEGMSTTQKLNALLMDTLHNPLDKPNELRPNPTFSYGISTLPSRAGSAFIGSKGRPVDVTIDPRELMPGYAGYANGGVVRRAEGSPIYGEGVDTGPITADTRRAFANRQSFNPREALAALKRIGMEGVSNLESLARGSVAGVPGVVGDFESIFRDDKARRFATSAEIERQRLPQRMTAPTRESQGFVEIGTAIDPNIALKAAKPVARATKRIAKELGPTAAAQLERLAPAAQPMYVVKPKGGVFYPEGSGSNLDNYLETVSELVLRNSPNIPGKEAKRVKDLIVNKGRKYFTTTYATGDDPIREALIEGRISLVGRDAKALPRELLRAAQDGDPEALRKIDELYDIRSNIRGEVVSPSTTNDKWMDKITEVRRKQNELMRQEGVPDEFLNTALMHKTLPELREPFPSEASKMLADLLEKKRGPVIDQEKTILEAVKRGQPIYDVRIAGPEFDILSDSTAAQGIASLSLKDIEKMSYPEMIIRGAQNTLLNRSTEELLKAAREGKSVPKKFFSEGVTPIKGLENTGWVSVDTPFAVQLEGAAMRHSVGDYAKKEGYGHGGKEGFLTGKAKVFSLRPEKAEPVITVESRVDPDGLYISQVKSLYNSVPTPEEKAQIFKLFDNLRDKYGALDFKAKLEPEAYKFTRTGQSIEKDIPKVNWYDEYSNYLQYRNKGAE